MAVNEYETSEERGQPVELLLFKYGGTSASENAYTTASRAIEFGGRTFEPLAIDRSKIQTQGRGEAEELTFEVPINSEIAELFRVFPPAEIVSLIVWQGHLPNPDDPVEYTAGDQFLAVWTGRVLESRRDRESATLSANNAQAGMKRVGLRLHYQIPCPLALYSSRCRADKPAAGHSESVVSIAGNVVEFGPGWSGAVSPESYVGGLIEWDGEHGREYRTILRIASDNLVTVNAALRGLEASDSVDVYLGCAHTEAACANLHDNIVNYGGFSRIPTKNPVGKNNHT